MHFKFLLASLVAATHSFAQHVHFEPPLVREYVQSMLSEFHEYTSYSGPSPTWWSSYSDAPTPTPTADTARKPAPDACDYWLEDIKHQGVAAFVSH